MFSTVSSDFRRATCLNGIWDFSVASDSIDTLPDRWESTGIKVPSPFNVNSFMSSYTRRFCGEECYVQGGDFRLYPEYPVTWEKARCGFYRRTVRVGSASRGTRLFLRFDAVAFHCAFYLNGLKIAETMEAFLPVEIEITDFVRYGLDNELIVACETSRYLIYKGQDGRNRLDYPQGSFWGSHIAGIWCDAWLIECPDAYVEDVFAVTDVDTRTLTIRYETAHARGETVAFTLKKWNSDEEARSIASGLPASGTAEWTWPDGGIDLWDFLEPNLYELTVRLIRDGKAVDERTIRIGFRTMRADGERFLLNGRPINLKIDAWHYLGYTVQTPEYARAYYRMALDAGVNIIRLHAEPFPEFFLDIADETGMLLVSESAVWASHCMFSYSPDFFRHSKEHLTRMILRDRNHPSVVMWSPENECIPAYHFCGSDYVKSVPELEDLIYDFIRVVDAYDTSRLISCDGSGDLGGRLPVNSIHYPRYDCPTHRGKPITIGEMGSMYYSTPDTVCREWGPRTLECFEGRLEAVAEDAFHDLIGERKWASQICVFNLVWYGLRPLPFRDRPLEWTDHSQPGAKPSRITPFMRTLNAGADPDLPAYRPNPVWIRAQEAYVPARSFLEHCPERIQSGEDYIFEVTTFNDLRQDADFTLVLTFGTARWSETFRIPSCGYREDRVSLRAPAPGPAELAVTLLRDGKEQHAFRVTVESVDVRALDEKLAGLGVAVLSQDGSVSKGPCLDCRKVSPYGDFIQATKQQHFFIAGEKIGYPAPVDCGVFESSLCFGGTPVLTDGSGQAVAIDLTPVGENRIVCALDLSGPEPTTAVLRLRLARILADRKAARPATRPYCIGDPTSGLAGMLKALSVDAEYLTPDELSGAIDPDRLLILDGDIASDDLEPLTAGRFKAVLLVGPTAAPRMFGNELRIRGDKLFHLLPRNGADALTGLTSTALYGLEANREQILATGCIEHLAGTEPILLGVPDVDWRLWNNNAEPLKTVAVHRSELRDMSRFSAFSVLSKAGTRYYLSTLSADSTSAKQRNIWSRILSTLGCVPPLRSADAARLLSADLYSDRVRILLSRPLRDGEDPASSRPDLDTPDVGDTWRIAREGQTGPALYAIYVDSPQDRRDLLANPDRIDLELSCESDTSLYLNGEPIASGRSCRVTGLKLAGGRNCLVCRVDGPAPLPRISFRRAKRMPLDLTFSLSP